MTAALAEWFDDLNPGEEDHRFYLALAEDLGPARILDLGCGTGTLGARLLAAGCAVTGIDPDPEMLRVARRKAPQGDWRLGTADRAGPATADLALMTGHVAQVFTDDTDWERTLRSLFRALTDGGTLAFESRNPSARGWERWTREGTLRELATREGPVLVWYETVWTSLPLVGYDTVVRNTRTGEEASYRSVLAFRSVSGLVESLSGAGFSVGRRYGDWDRSPLRDDSPEIILVARRG